MTEQKQGREKEEFTCKAILDNIPDIAWLKDSQGSFIMVNERFAKACGYKPEEIIGKTDRDIWPADLAESYHADDQEVMKSKKRKYVQERLADKEGKVQWLETIKTPIFDDQGKVIGITGIARDITHRRKEEEKLQDIKAELELRVKVRTAELTSLNEELRKEIRERKIIEKGLVDSEAKFRALFDDVPDGMAIADISTKEILLVNKAFCRILGYHEGKAENLNVRDIHPAEDLPYVMEIFSQMSKQLTSFVEDCPMKRKDGTVFYADITSAPIVLDGRKCLLGNFRDVSQRKIIENNISHLISIQSATLEATVDGILVVNTEGKITAYNQKFLELWKVPKEIISTKDDRKILASVLKQLTDSKGFLKRVKELYKNKDEVSSDTIKFKDGRVFERYSRPQTIEGKALGRVWSFRDVTENRKYEEELKLYREKLETLVEQRTKLLEQEIESRKAAELKANNLNKQIEYILGATKTGLNIIDKNYNIRYVDPGWARNYGDWTGKKCYDYFADQKGPCPTCALDKAFQTKNVVVWEAALIKEGNRPIQITSIPYQDEKGEWLVAEVSVDISQKKKIDEELEKYRNHLEQLVAERTQELLEETARCRNSEFEKSKLNRELLKTNEKLKSISLIDSHTGLYNYRYLQDIIEAEFHQARRYAQNLSIIILDVDYFKSINDVYGIAFGDLVLKQLASQLKRMVRRYDILVRYSGEEFIIISPRLDRTIAFNMAQRLLDSLNFINFGNKKHSVKLKLSFAVVSFPEDRAKNGMDLVNLANKVLNKVKESGGNRAYSSLDIKSQLKKGLEEISKAVGVKTLRYRINKLNKQTKQGLTESIFAFAKTLELKDHYTGEHVENTVHFATEIAKALNLPNEDIELIRQASMLHDLGKIGIPENILLKKGKLTRKEFEEIKKHPQIGADIIRPIQFLRGLIPFIFYHHERWDGKGYPSGIRGEDIPLGARVIAIADVYQALISDRPYHKAFSKNVAIEMIKKASGTQFDPRIVNTFLKIVSPEKKSPAR